MSAVCFLLAAQVVRDVINNHLGCAVSKTMGHQWHDGRVRQRAELVGVGHVVKGTGDI